MRKIVLPKNMHVTPSILLLMKYTSKLNFSDYVFQEKPDESYRKKLPLQRIGIFRSFGSIAIFTGSILRLHLKIPRFFPERGKRIIFKKATEKRESFTLISKN